MRIVVTFDAPCDRWEPPDHERRMATEVSAWKHHEPEMEYQIGAALRQKGHDVRLVGVRNDLQSLVARLDEVRPASRFPLIVKPLQSDASAGIAQASVVQDAAALADPFFSYGHDMANAAEKAGMDYSEFIQRLVNGAVARHGRA